MMGFTEKNSNKIDNIVDLSLLPPPSVVKSFSSAEIYEKMKDDFIAEMKKEYKDYVFSDSDPAAKVLFAASYRAELIYQRVNDSVSECFLATAQGSNLTQIAKLYSVDRDMLEDGSLESDESLREKVLLSFDRFSTGGSESSYVFHAKKVGTPLGMVHCNAYSKQLGTVGISVLFKDHDKDNSSNLKKIENYLTSEKIRPLNEILYVSLADIVPVELEADIYVPEDAYKDVVFKEVLRSLENFSRYSYKAGQNIAVSAIYSALSVANVLEVNLKNHTSGVAVTDNQAVKIVVNLEKIKVMSIREKK